MTAAIVFAVSYNFALWRIIQKAKISNEFHEYQLQKKEVERVLSINSLWRTNKYFTFSSYKSGVMAMYHRIYFNALAIILVILEVSMVRF